MPARVCYGLLGPNGAGKSTTMRILTGQAIADAGQASVLGFRLPAESKLARARMGVCPQESNLDVDLCVRDVLEVFARLYRVPAGERAAAVDRALALAGLQARARDKAVKLSGRHAAPPADRAGADPPARARAARRADRRAWTRRCARSCGR